MAQLRNIVIGTVAIVLAVGASILSQLQNDTHAANTLSGVNEIVNIATTDGQPPNQSVFMYGDSGDGNIILFSSKATNLPSATGARYAYDGGLFTYNIASNTTLRIDLSSSGVPANQTASLPLISENGRYVLFMSRATNLIDGTTQREDQPYIHDTQTGSTIALSNHVSLLTYDGTEYPLGISNDGRFVLMGTRYINGDAFHSYHAVLGDRSTGTFVWRTLETQTGGSTGIDFNAGGMSCDGSFVVYDHSTLTIPRDMRDDISVGSTVTSMHGISPIVSCNGTYILYATTNRTDVSPTPTGMSQYLHLVEYNRLTGDRKYIDSDNNGVFDNNHRVYSVGSYAEQSPNFFSASVADTGDVVLMYNGKSYLKHISDGSGTLEPVAKTQSGSYVDVTTKAQISSNGRYIFFTADPYSLGLAPSPSGVQIIRAKTNL